MLKFGSKESNVVVSTDENNRWRPDLLALPVKSSVRESCPVGLLRFPENFRKLAMNLSHAN